jgi:hypothetical protein
MAASVKPPVSDIREMPFDRSRGGHHGADKVRSSAAALAAFEIAVAG